MSDDKSKKTSQEKSELAIKELEEAYKTYTNEDIDKIYGYTDEDCAYSIPQPSWASSWPSSWASSTWGTSGNVFDSSPVDWDDHDEIIYNHGDLEVGTLVRHEQDVGVVMKKVDVGVTDEIIENLKNSGIVINAVNMDNFFGSWDFKQGYDNNFYYVAIAGKAKKIIAIGWKLKEISKDK
tara:strand:- start:6934 stop:7473 length:540 start_codon:yes stop_codon:yes gene_type:complete